MLDVKFDEIDNQGPRLFTATSLNIPLTVCSLKRSKDYLYTVRLVVVMIMMMSNLNYRTM